MKLILVALTSLAVGAGGAWLSMSSQERDVPGIKIDLQKGNASDSGSFLALALEVEDDRVRNRIGETEFSKKAEERDTVILDARGTEYFDRLHVKGAINLPYTHFTAAALQDIIPSQDSQVLIYCRNNLSEASSRESGTPKFVTASGRNAKVEVVNEFIYPTEFDPPEIPKDSAAGLNIPTFVTLHTYGYNNVWELDDIVDPNDSPIEFAASRVRQLGR